MTAVGKCLSEISGSEHIIDHVVRQKQFLCPTGIVVVDVERFVKALFFDHRRDLSLSRSAVKLVKRKAQIVIGQLDQILAAREGVISRLVSKIAVVHHNICTVDKIDSALAIHRRVIRRAEQESDARNGEVGFSVIFDNVDFIWREVKVEPVVISLDDRRVLLEVGDVHLGAVHVLLSRGKVLKAVKMKRVVLVVDHHGSPGIGDRVGAVGVLFFGRLVHIDVL